MPRWVQVAASEARIPQAAEPRAVLLPQESLRAMTAPRSWRSARLWELQEVIALLGRAGAEAFLRRIASRALEDVVGAGVKFGFCGGPFLGAHLRVARFEGDGVLEECFGPGAPVIGGGGLRILVALRGAQGAQVMGVALVLARGGGGVNREAVAHQQALPVRRHDAVKGDSVPVFDDAAEGDALRTRRGEHPQAAGAVLPPARFVGVQHGRGEQLRAQRRVLDGELVRGALKCLRQAARAHFQTAHQFQRATGLAQRQPEAVLEFGGLRHGARTELHACAATRGAHLARVGAAHQLFAARAAALIGRQPRDVRAHRRQLLDELLDRREHLQRARAVRTATQRHLDDSSTTSGTRRQLPG